MKRAFFCLALLAACRSSQIESPYLRVTADSGRIYYADTRNLLRSETGGFLAFRDLVTNEPVRLTNGTYSAQIVPFQEIDVRREEYMYNPARIPRVDE